MLFITPLVAALISTLATAAPAPGNSWGTGGGPPSGYYTVENFCSAPTVLACCNGITAVGVAGEPTTTHTGCTNAMADNSVTYEYGYCPTNYRPYCCLADAAGGIDTGCGLPTQVNEPSS